jgi:hypothetical protein
MSDCLRAKGTLLLLAILALAGCGGAGGSERARLERALARGGKTVCDGNCKTFHAEHATCTRVLPRATTHFYRCRVSYDNGGRAEHVCAALANSKAVLRPLRMCAARKRSA